MSPLTIAYVSVDDPGDARAWSGTVHHLRRALVERGHRLVDIGPLRPQPLLLFCRMLNQLSLRLLGRRFHYRDSFILSRAYARIIHRRLRGIEADLVLAPAGLAAIAHLRTALPIVHFNDRCLAGAVGYHAILTDVLGCSLRRSLALERVALRRADLTVYASSWAADAARKVEPSRAAFIRMIPMGANLTDVPAALIPRDVPSRPVKLLFIGVHWEHKGGPVAVEALRALGRKGIPAELIVCGCTVPPSVTDGNIVREGFLDKSDPAQRARLQGHLRSADLFILPTRFEAYGIAFCEAAAYGIPALGTRTGGVPSIVLEGETGHLLPLEADGAAFADRIEELLVDAARWQRMRIAARKRYGEVLTWKAFVQRLEEEIVASGLIKAAR